MAGDDNGMMDDEADGDETTAPPRPTAAQSVFSNGMCIGTGVMPHRDPVSAAAFAIAEFDAVSIPILSAGPRGSAALEQAVAGLPGVSSHDGRLHTDGTLLGGDRIRAALDDPSFAGMCALLDMAGKIGLDGVPVVWHHVGPVTLGVALCQAGLDIDTAFPLAIRAVRTQLAEVASTISAAIPRSEQLVMLDEPVLADLMAPDFPIPPDHAVDLMSTGMAAVAQRAIVGIHCDEPCDLATMLASGPAVISVPAETGLVEWAGYLDRFLDDGGVVAWGVVPCSGPVAFTADRYWRALSDLWCDLVRRGCDPVALRRQSLLTPGGRLDRHSVSVARRIARMNAEVGRRVKDQAHATRFALGA